MGAFAWVLVCAVVFLFDAGAVAESMDSPQSEDVGGHSSGREDLGNLLSEARGKKKKSMRMIMAVKMLIFSILIPKVIALALFASWKGITVSLIALTIAVMAALKHAQSSQGTEKSVQHILIKKDPGTDQHHHEHWWRRIREAEPVYSEEHHKGPYHGWED